VQHAARELLEAERSHKGRRLSLSPPLTFGPDAAAEHCFSIRFSASSGAHMCTSLALSAVGIVRLPT